MIKAQTGNNAREPNFKRQPAMDAGEKDKISQLEKKHLCL